MQLFPRQPVGGSDSFIETHRVSFVTLDIGADDIDHCISISGIDTGCIQTGSAKVATNLRKILAALRAAGAFVPIVAMNYYDPFLPAWTLIPPGQPLAKATVQATNEFNQLLEQVYGAFSIPVADVAYTFQVNNSGIIPFINQPVNVSITLTWTWMAAPRP